MPTITANWHCFKDDTDAGVAGNGTGVGADWRAQQSLPQEQSLHGAGAVVRPAVVGRTLCAITSATLIRMRNTRITIEISSGLPAHLTNVTCVTPVSFEAN